MWNSALIRRLSLLRLVCCCSAWTRPQSFAKKNLSTLLTLPHQHPTRIVFNNGMGQSSRVTPLSAKNDPNNGGEEKSIPFLPVAIVVVAILAFWPLLALFRDTNDPTSGFDVDMFMALKGILDSGNGANFDNNIIELPPLSPAEQLVGAIFGPP